MRAHRRATLLPFHAADHHGVEILTRAGYSKTVMIKEGSSGGGYLATHPSTQEGFDALNKL